MTWHTTGTDPAALWHWRDQDSTMAKTICGARFIGRKVIANADALRGTMHGCHLCLNKLRQRGTPHD